MRAWNSTLSRKAVLRYGSPGSQDARKSRAPLNRMGKKGLEWKAVWQALKPRFEAARITSCELRREGCLGRLFLTPAHSRKRRNITTREGLEEVVIACSHCHSQIEAMPEAEMCAIVRATIDARPVPI